MGTSSSKPVLPSATVLEATRVVLDLFLPIFVKGLGIAMVDLAVTVRQLADGDRGLTHEARLLKPPIPSVPLRRGWIVKLGGKMKVWKRR